MNKHFLLASLLVIANAFVAIAQNKSFTTDNDLGIKKYTLDNGLTVFISHNPAATDVFGAIVVNAGGKNDPVEATGIAHYLEHMLFKGTQELGTTNFGLESHHLDTITQLYDQLGKTTDPKKRDEIQLQINHASVNAAKYAIPNETDRLISSIGGKNVNAFTSNDMTVYFNSFPAHQIDAWLDIYAHRFVKPVFRLFQSELETVFEEKNRAEEQFYTHIMEKFAASFFKNHPYGQQTILGKHEHIKNPSLTKMYEFYNKYYVASNMALVLVGNIDAESAISKINETFGTWEKREKPTWVGPKEQPFKGRELVKVRMSPVAMGGTAFRAVPFYHPDRQALEVLEYMLNNSNQTGLFDKLMAENKLLMATVYTDYLKEQGLFGVLFVPKILVQSNRAAEELIMQQIDKLRKGQFDSADVEAAKENLLVENARARENNFNRAYQIAEWFVNDVPIEQGILEDEYLRKIDKNELVRVANQYLNNNRLCLHSHMGKPKKNMIKKPAFKPVKGDPEAESEYAMRFKKIEPVRPNGDFIDFNKDIESVTLESGVQLFVSPNPHNDIFTLNLFIKPNKPERWINQLTVYFNETDTKNHKSIELKRKLANLACKVSFSAHFGMMQISLEGYEPNLQPALDLLADLLANTIPTENAVKSIINAKKGEVKFEGRDAADMGDVLLEYMVYGSNSEYLTRPTLSEVKKQTAQFYADLAKSTKQWEAQFTYVGKTPAKQLSQMLGTQLPNGYKPGECLPHLKPFQKNQKPKIFVHLRNDAVQTQLYAFSELSPFKPEIWAPTLAFNTYFDGDMGSIMFQEVRELRSLAYSAFGRVRHRGMAGEPMYFSAYIGCQADKTIEAIGLLDSLIKLTPMRPERETTLRNDLINSALSAKPSFRQIPITYLLYKQLGFDADPYQANLKFFEDFNFEQIQKYYIPELEKQTYHYALVVNPKKVNLELLKKYGEIITLKDADIRKK